MKGISKSLVFIVTISLTLLAVYSCSGRGASESDSYIGPGSDWRTTINNDGSFTFVEAIASLTLTGSWQPQVGPFKKFTVETSSNTGSVAVGSEAFGLDIPGVAFILKPLSGTQMISMVKSGECPTDDGTMNWIITKYDGAPDFSSVDLFGTFQFTAASNSATLPYKYKLDGTVFGTSDSLGSFNCADGKATVAGGTMYLHEVGALVNTTSNQFIIGFLQSEIGQISNLDDTYYGLLFQESTGSVQTVKGVLTANTLTVTDIDTSTGLTNGTVSASLTVNAVDTPQNGFVQMTIGSDTVRCMANPDIASSGKKLLFCVAKDPAGTTTQLYNLLLITE